MSHCVRGYVHAPGFSELVFTAYRLTEPTDVLTQEMIGSGIACLHDRAAFWFDAGNFRTPWQPGEELIVVVELLNRGTAYFGVTTVVLDAGTDIQDIGEIEFLPMPELQYTANGVRWDAVDHGDVIGYSVYSNTSRLNQQVITSTEYRSQQVTDLRPVFSGGYETVYSSDQHIQDHTPHQASFSTCPNPFSAATVLTCAVPRQMQVDIEVYDVTGALVRTVISGELAPGYHDVIWSGDDDHGRTVAAGIYFIRENLQGAVHNHKIIRVR